MAMQTLPTAATGTGFTPPVADYEFLLNEAFGTDIVARSTGGTLTAEDAMDAIAAAGEFAAEVVAPLNRVGDTDGARLVNGAVHVPEGFKEAYATFAQSGWVSAASSEKAGGDGLPISITTVLSEFWNASNAAFTLCPGLSLGAIRTIASAASQELKSPISPRWSRASGPAP